MYLSQPQFQVKLPHGLHPEERQSSYRSFPVHLSIPFHVHPSFLVPLPSPGHTMSGETQTCSCGSVALGPGLIAFVKQPCRDRSCKSSGQVVGSTVHSERKDHMGPASILAKQEVAMAGYLNPATNANSSPPAFCVTHVSKKKSIIENPEYEICKLP